MTNGQQNKAPGANAAQPAKGKGKGCLHAVVLAVIILGILAALVATLTLWHVRKLREDFTDTTVEPVPVEQVEEDQARQLTHSYEQLQRAVQQNQSDTFVFTDDELNKMLAAVPAIQEARGRAHFTIENGTVKVKTAVPLDQMPGFEDRVLNGEFTLDIAMADGDLSIRVLEANVRGTPLPKPVMQHLRSLDLADMALQDPSVREQLKGIRSIRIDDDKLIIQTGSK